MGEDMAHTDVTQVDTARSGRAGERGEAGGVQSVDRAVTVLEVLARHGEVGTGTIATELGVHKSTASRLLGVLHNRGLVEHAQARGKYCLGVGMLRLAGAAALRLDLSQEGQPVCRELAEEVGETANVAVLSDDDAVNVMQARGPATMTAYNWLGRRTPLHATSSGKTLLAHLSTSRQQALLAGRLRRYTKSTLTSAEHLRHELTAVVRQGYARSVEELEIGLNAVAAPVYGHDGAVIGALSVSGPVYRVTEERLDKLGHQTIQAGEELSRRMGYPGPPQHTN